MLYIADVGIRGNEAHHVQLMHADTDLTSPLTKGRTRVRVTSYCPKWRSLHSLHTLQRQLEGPRSRQTQRQ